MIPPRRSVPGAPKKALRRGFTTGTAAAAGAKAAALALLRGERVRSVDVTLPRGGVLAVAVREVAASGGRAEATVVKDGGDDPDVTDKAEIVTAVELLEDAAPGFVEIRGGEGVGTVTKPGLKVPVGEPAINPVPRQMIRKSVAEAAGGVAPQPALRVTVTVPDGARLAAATMNARLGIVGGISILGTTGVVEPLSLDAYRHSISCALDVAAAAGLQEVVLSTGRTSERVVQSVLDLPETAFILTGDHMGFALDELRRRPTISRVTIAAQFGKMTKLASGAFATHCSDSAVSLPFLASLAAGAGADRAAVRAVERANTARHAFFMLARLGLRGVYGKVVELVRKGACARCAGARGAGVEVRVILVGFDDEVAALTGPPL
ncbi:MAG TPA: cobalt-precorrin-5B (C(1))-methyltransferase [Deltaproteobacteria bacterium]|nr:cobalt-precorrin-5B (C(1))-methyltransferase [Deltaproteobacteria bacterium]